MTSVLQDRNSGVATWEKMVLWLPDPVSPAGEAKSN